MSHDLAPNTILRVLDSACLPYPIAATDGQKVTMGCIFPDAHENGDYHRSAWVNGERNIYGCSKCGIWTAKGLAQKLNVPWPVDGARPPIVTKPARPAVKAPDQNVVRAAWIIGLAEQGKMTLDHPVFRYLADRGLDEAVRGKDPLAVVWPEDGLGLPEPYAYLPAKGYRLAARLYDVRSGELAAIQARHVGPLAPEDGRKTRFAQGEGQSSGKVFANQAAISMMRATADPPRRVIVAEGLTDHLALGNLYQDVPVVAVAGSSVVKASFVPPPKWMRPGMEVISALDGDEPGEVGAKDLAEGCRAAGAICRRVKYPADCKDACDILKVWDSQGLRLAIEKAELPATIRLFSRASKPLEEYRMNKLATPESIIGDGLLRPRTFGFLFGAPGSGKSWVALDLALSVASGRSWYGIPVKQCRAGYLSLELERWDLTERLEAIMYARGLTQDDIGDRLHLISPPDFDDSFDLLDPDHCLALQSWIQENRLDFSVVDTLSRAHSADEKDMRPVLNAALSVVRRTDSGMIFVHHPRKPAQPMPGQRPTSNGQYEMRGDSRMNGDGRLVIQLNRRRGVLELIVDKTNTGRTGEPIYLRPNDRGVMEVTELPQTKQEIAAENRERILAVLAEADAPMSRLMIVERTVISVDAVKRALASLVKSGEVTSSGSTKDRRFAIRADDSGASELRPNQNDLEF